MFAHKTIPVWIGLVVALAFCSVGTATEYTVIQLTNNDYPDRSPKIKENRQIVWLAYEFGVVMLYDGTSTIQIMGWCAHPDVNDSGQVVMDSFDGSDDEIYLYDGTDPIPLTDNDYDDQYPRINNSGQVVWVGHPASGDSEIFLHDGIETIQVTSNDYADDGPVVSENRYVAWLATLGSDPSTKEVFLYDGTEIIQLTNNDHWDSYPDINSSGQVAWAGSGIWLYDGTTTTQITDNMDGHPVKLNDNGQMVTTSFDGSDDEIYLYDGTEIIQLSNNEYNDEYPEINNEGLVVWRSYDGADYEIYLYDGTTTIQLTDNNYEDFWPQINDNGDVVWHGEPTGWRQPEIFLAMPCSPSNEDFDGDGYVAAACGGDDCNDGDPDLHPAATELCDNGIDEDCDGLTDYEDTDCPCLDNDGDGYGVYDNPDCTYAGLDCDDEDLDQNPGAVEFCWNGIEDDCDGLRDYEDADCPSLPGIVVLRDGEFDDDEWDHVVISTGCFMFCGAVHAADGGNPGEYLKTFCLFNECNKDGEGAGIVFHGYGRTYNPGTDPISSVDYSADWKNETDDFGTYYHSPALRQGGIIFTASWHPFYPAPIWSTITSTNLTETSFWDEQGSHPDFSISGAPIQFGYLTIAPADGFYGPPDYMEGVDNWQVILYTSSGSYFATANAHAASYGAHSLIGSGMFNELSLLLVPVGGVVLLRIWRRKK